MRSVTAKAVAHLVSFAQITCIITHITDAVSVVVIRKYGGNHYACLAFLFEEASAPMRYDNDSQQYSKPKFVKKVARRPIHMYSVCYKAKALVSAHSARQLSDINISLNSVI